MTSLLEAQGRYRSGPFDPLTRVVLSNGLAVASDAVKIHGVRIATDPITAQFIADVHARILGCEVNLCEPEDLDRMFQEAYFAPPPYPQAGCPMTEEAADMHSGRIDAYLQRDPDRRGALVAPTGKQWIPPRIGTRADRSGIYGWHVPAHEVKAHPIDAWNGIPVYRSQDGHAWVIQPEQYGHVVTPGDGPDRSGHVDYSMFLRLKFGPLSRNRRRY